MRIFFIRHGESQANVRKIHAGWFDSPITEKGIMQAQAVIPIVRNISFSKIYSSDLSRALDTAKIVFGDREIICRQELREINMEKISNIPYDQLIDKYGDLYLECRKHWDFSPLGCESIAEFKHRVYSFIDEVVLNEEYADVAIVTHAGVIRAMASKIIGVEISDRHLLKIDNSSVCVFSYDKENGWQILHWNYIYPLQ